MADFLTLAAQSEQRFGHYTTQLFRIESHMRRGESRAAKARLDGLLVELDALEHSFELALETAALGAQLGFLSGDGPFFRGRFAAAVVGAAAGWLFGQAALATQYRYVTELRERVEQIRQELNSNDGTHDVAE